MRRSHTFKEVQVQFPGAVQELQVLSSRSCWQPWQPSGLTKMETAGRIRVCRASADGASTMRRGPRPKKAKAREAKVMAAKRAAEEAADPQAGSGKPKLGQSGDAK